MQKSRNSLSRGAAVEFEESIVYCPDARLSYVGWVSLFPFGNGDPGVAFQDIRRSENPDRRPLTPVRHRPGHTNVYMEHGNLLVTPGMAEQFPDLEQVIARLDQHNPTCPGRRGRTWPAANSGR